MRLTTMTDYAVRLLMHLARHEDRLCTIAEVAQAYGISEAHLMKITHQLALQGWIETVRGRGGGMRLARPASDINLGELVRHIEPDFALVECFTADNRCVITGTCRLNSALGGALQQFFAHLDGFSLADVMPPLPSAEGAVPLRRLQRRGAAARSTP